MSHEYDAIVFGGGPAGLTAGICLARARVRTLIVDTGTVGGQMILSYATAALEVVAYLDTPPAS